MGNADPIYYRDSGGPDGRLTSVKQRRGPGASVAFGKYVPPTRTAIAMRRARCKDHPRFMTHDPIDPLAAFAELGRVKLSETSLDDILNQVAAAAQRALPGAADVSITLVRQHGPY